MHRWDYYFQVKGQEFGSFWKEKLLKKGNVLYIIGEGFDPRMCHAAKNILEHCESENNDCLLLWHTGSPFSDDDILKEHVADNRKKLDKLFEGRGKVIPIEIKMWHEDGGRVGAQNVSTALRTFNNYNDYADIIIDISALPRSIYFVLIANMLYMYDKMKQNNPGKSRPNIHVVVTEHAKLDSFIKENGIDEKAEYLHGFTAHLESEAFTHIPKVWIPVLGEGKLVQMSRIHDLIDPSEVCPVFPSPSSNPRRADDLLLEYREYLFDIIRVEPSNIIYACEQNPFETYRQILNTALHYDDALNTLGGSRAVISALSSKLLSIGALLAAIELKKDGKMVGIAQIEPRDYEFNLEEYDVADAELFTIFLAGEVYEK